MGESTQCEAFTLTHIYDADGTPVPGHRCLNRALPMGRCCAVHEDRSHDYGKLLRRGIGLVMEALRAEGRGDWTPDVTESALLAFFGRAVRARNPREPEPDLFDAIENHLRHAGKP